MIRNIAVRARIIITLALLLVMISPLSQSTWAQTPDAPIDPPVVTEIPTEVPTEVPPPPVTEAPVPIPTDVPPPPPPTAVPPVETEVPPTETQVVPTETQVVPTETEEVVETPTDVPTEVQTEVEVTETVTAPSTPTEEAKAATPTPTPTEEVIDPDQLELVSAGAVTIGPGESRDITVRYTLGSDRNKTEMTVNLAGPAGESLEGWSITPVNRGDTLDDPNDANRMYKAGIDETSAIQRENTFDTTWRLTAPAHIEKPLILNMSFSAKIHRDDGVTDGAIQANFVTATAIASIHAPVPNCTAAVGEGIANTWNCLLETTHPAQDVVVTTSAVVPAGWELKLNAAAKLTDVAITLDSTVVQAGAFTLSADYPIGCPDAGATDTATLSMELTYPSGEVTSLTQDLALTFERPSPTLEITSFEFTEFNILESLSTTGALTISYADAPCDWVATIEIADLYSDTFTVSDAVISITGSEGRADALISITDGTISIQAPESVSNASSGEITIYLQINLPHQIPPGSYVIGVVTEIKLRDEL